MSSTTLPFAGVLDGLGTWRTGVQEGLDRYVRELAAQELLDPALEDRLKALRERLGDDKLVVAFVAEFSRGKSELINAIFFSDTGRRILPATPGRTTMCPVELGHTPGTPPTLRLLPIETRLEGTALSELRARPGAWTVVPLDLGSAESLAASLSEVMRTRTVSLDEARSLGFWDDQAPDDNPPMQDGRVEIPQWRHALIDYPHPLLQRGLVVLDTPGLNALGAEPELTLGLLPSAHATVFILGADTGVTKSDAAIWRDHLAGDATARFVVLNKIDTLVDPLSPADVVAAQIERQCRDTARLLSVPRDRVFPISARQALAARVEGQPAALATSGVPELEAALAGQVLPQRREMLERMVLEAVQHAEAQVQRRMVDRRRQLAEQMLELRGLRGKSQAKLRAMVQRVDGESQEFETSMQKLQAMRLVHARMLKDTLAVLSSDGLRMLVGEMQSSMFGFGAKASFAKLCEQLRGQLRLAARKSDEIHEMLAASFATLNADFGFSLQLPGGPDVAGYVEELDALERHYEKFLGLKQALRLAQPGFMEQFRRMLTSRLRLLFETASSRIELWNREASTMVDTQLRERRRAFKRRREALERIQGAAGELETRLQDFEAQESRLQQVDSRLAAHGASLRRLATGSVGAWADQAPTRQSVASRVAHA